jgi:hypothetical protein
MYRCEECGAVVPPGVPAVKQVVETREREYPVRQLDPSRQPKGRARRRRRPGDPGGSGREIVHERVVCPRCADADDRG